MSAARRASIGDFRAFPSSCRPSLVGAIFFVAGIRRGAVSLSQLHNGALQRFRDGLVFRRRFVFK
jgi:hypothetical protein